MTPDRDADPAPPLTVAVTGPTGDIGRSLLRGLEQTPEVREVVAMGRRPFDPAAEGLGKVSYHRADVLDAGAVRDLVDGADVVVHLAFIIMGGAKETTQITSPARATCSAPRAHPRSEHPLRPALRQVARRDPAGAGAHAHAATGHP